MNMLKKKVVGKTGYTRDKKAMRVRIKTGEAQFIFKESISFYSMFVTYIMNSPYLYIHSAHNQHATISITTTQFFYHTMISTP